jgi:hypothetical protein
MHKKRPGPSSTLACCLALIAGPVHAAGFGDSGSGAVLGQPLDFVVQLRVDAGEVLTSECVAAEVTSGDRRLPAPLVRTAIERSGPESARVRVTTTQSIDEPVIGILLQVGCTARISRRFVVLADPPITAQAQAPAMATVPLVSAAPSLPAVPGGSAVGSAPAGDPPQPAAPRVQPSADAPRQAAAPVRQPASQPPRPVAAAPQAAAASRPVRRAAPALPAAASVAAPASAAAVKTARGDAAPRLRLDMVEPAPGASQAIEQALEAVAQAASATRAATAAASAAEQRIATLERTVEQLRGDARISRNEAAELRSRLGRGDGSNPWLWPLLLGLALLAALAAWLARELMVLRRAQQRTWQQGLKSAQARATEADQVTITRTPTSPIPFVTSEIVAPPATSLSGRGSGQPPGRAWPAPVTAPMYPSDTLPPELAPSPAQPPALSTEDRATHRTLPLPYVGVGPEQGSPRDVSIEELIDLEQQAEFFVVLGQDEAAVDLLVEHLRSTGGGSPLPYLKLLEIHHRRGDREAYDRTRSRFNQRFNAYAPDWDSGLQHGRSLEDYAGIIPRLQQVWPRPLDAMAELEALLFRKSRGDLFDLPAYRDVLFLYSLARDLLDREAAHTGDVDLLLPLADGGEFGSTTPHPYFGIDHDSVFDGSSSDDMPTTPVDLDLSVGDRPAARIFHPLAASRPGS